MSERASSIRRVPLVTRVSETHAIRIQNGPCNRLGHVVRGRLVAGAAGRTTRRSVHGIGRRSRHCVFHSACQQRRRRLESPASGRLSRSYIRWPQRLSPVGDRRLETPHRLTAARVLAAESSRTTYRSFESASAVL